MNKLKNLIANFVQRVYKLLFKEEMSEEMKAFVLNLGYLSFSTIISGILLFTFNILSGRLLGPLQYGNYSLIISLSNFLIIPMLFGFNLSIIKYLAKGRNQQEIISTSLISVLLFSLLSAIIFLIFRQYIVHILKIDNSLFLSALIFTIIYAFYSMAKAVMQALHRLKEYAFFEIVVALVIFVSFAVAVFGLKEKSYLSPTTANGLGYFSLVILVLFCIKKYLKQPKFSRPHFNEMFGYGLLITISSIFGFALGNTDRLVINYFWGASQVGLYSAYFIASMTIIGQGLQIFITAFFPAACRAEKKDMVLKKLNIVSKNLLYILPPISFGVISIIIFLFGRQYPYRLDLALIFALNTVFFILSRIYGWFMASEGKRGIRLNTYLTILAAVLNLGLNLALVPKLAILGAVIATLIVSIFMTLSMAIGCRRLFVNQQ